MAHFDPPAGINDFERSPRQEELTEGWHTIIDSWLTSAVERTDGLFYNPNSAQAPTGGDRAPIFWEAFPLVIRNWFDGQPDSDELRFQAADVLRPFLPGGRRLRAVRDGQLAEELDLSHRQQDEYCEWHVTRGEDGSITSIQFTSEGPEYWEFLMSGTRPFFPPGDPRADITAGDPDLVLTLYREHVSPDVQPEDLVWQHDVAAFRGPDWVFHALAGDYNPLNKWNTTHGAMHLTHPSNTLRAEVALAADSTVLRTAPNDAEALVCCAGYGDINRSSDPLIGLGVNQAAAANHWVTLADPIGLYIAEMNTGALSHPDAWTVVRGSAADQSVLRARIDVPEGADLTVGGAPLRFGGQAAEHIGMVLTGQIVARTGTLPAAHGCDTACCSHPDRPSFKALVGAGDDCDGVPWDALAPHLPSGPVVEEPESAPPSVEAEVYIAPAPGVRAAAYDGHR